MSSKQVSILALATLLGFSFLGILGLFIFRPEELPAIFFGKSPLYIQILSGLVAGVSTGFLALFITRSPWVRPSAERYEEFFQKINFTKNQIIGVSFCAGVGEEIFFRGFLQYYLGIWLTSFVFVAIHGYLNPRDWRISIYGASMVGVIGLYGWLYESFGIWSPATAHFIFDVILLWSVRKMSPNNLNLVEDKFKDHEEVD